MHEKIHIALYASDISAGTKMFPLVAKAAEIRGHDVFHIPSQTKPLAKHIDYARTAHALVLNLASNRTEHEMEFADRVCELHPNPSKVIAIADTKDALLRPKAQEFSRNVDAALVAFPEDTTAAREFGYSRVDYRGIPPHFEKSYNDMKVASERRASFQKAMLGQEPAALGVDDVLVGIHGNKTTPERVNLLLRTIAETAFDILKDRLVVAFRPHPGEEKEVQQQEGVATWKRILDIRQRIVQSTHGIIPFLTDDVTGAALIGASDLSIFTGGGPTDSITAAQLGLPMIYMNENAKAIVGQQITGAASWWVAERGGMHSVCSTHALRGAIVKLVTPEGRARQAARAKAAFPIPETWNTADAYVDYIEEVVRGQKRD